MKPHTSRSLIAMMVALCAAALVAACSSPSTNLNADDEGMAKAPRVASREEAAQEERAERAAKFARARRVASRERARPFPATCPRSS
ncbi:MAG: hypothetical protein U0169_18355 [Polyangiaceae bacterium]